ncbi:hypothetical protein [Mucilaginibacter panaciglaebae]|uniref:hypothetical protein n=1 Tax=Mucilaginibacter panaciglaebae TaxID=502331 RepID=UPI0031EB8B2C
MKQSITLALQLYRLLLLYNIAFTVAGIFFAYMSAGHFDFGVLVYGKIVGFTAALGLYHFSAKQSYFYFRNAGYHLRPIITITFVIDVAVCILPSTVILLIQLCSHLF